MLTVTLDELSVNAVNAALDLRLSSLRASLRNLLRHPQSADRDFAVEVVADAIAHTEKARSTITATLPDPEYPVDMSVLRLDWSEVELRAAWGDR